MEGGGNIHVSDYILKTGKGLGRVSDQTIEASHSALNKRLVASKYIIKDIESDLHGKFLSSETNMRQLQWLKMDNS